MYNNVVNLYTKRTITNSEHTYASNKFKYNVLHIMYVLNLNLLIYTCEFRTLNFYCRVLCWSIIGGGRSPHPSHAVFIANITFQDLIKMYPYKYRIIKEMQVRSELNSYLCKSADRGQTAVKQMGEPMISLPRSSTSVLVGTPLAGGTTPHPARSWWC